MARVLVIDDAASIRDLLREALRFLGFEVDVAANGVEGLALFEREGFDLIVTDLMMPGLTGWEVAAEVRRRAPTHGVIMITGSASNLDTDRARELGLTLLPKPFQIEDLRRAVEEALNAKIRREKAVVQNEPVQVLGTLPTAIQTLRNLAAQLESAIGTVERLIRERDELAARWTGLEREHQSLRQAHEGVVVELRTATGALNRLQAEHETMAQTLVELRQQRQALSQESERTAEALSMIVRRLRG